MQQTSHLDLHLDWWRRIDTDIDVDIVLKLVNTESLTALAPQTSCGSGLRITQLSRTAASGLLCSVLVAGDNNFWSCCISIGWLILGIPISLPTVRKTLWAHSIKCTNLITHLPSHVCQTPSVQRMPVVAHCCRPEQTCQQRAARERFQNARTCLGEQRPSSTAENKTVLTMSFLRAT